MLLEFVALLLVVLYLIISNGGFDCRLMWYFDPPSLIAILLLTLPAFFLRGMWKNFMTAVKLCKKDFRCPLSEMKKAQYAVGFLQKHLLCTGFVIVLVPLIYIIAYAVDSQALGPGIAVALIGALYTALLEFLLLPLENIVKKRILDYMEEE